MDKSSRRCAQMGTKIWTVAQTAVTDEKTVAQTAVTEEKTVAQTTVTEEKTVPQTAVTPTTFDWGNPV